MFLSSHAILKSISIHAPAKGATKWIAKNPEAYAFQSTLPRRERRCIYPLVIYCSLFQSTLPRRERRWGKSDAETRVFYFNPRSREGSDSVGLVREYYVQDFNPRSREGSDDNDDRFYMCTVEFQSTLPRRERQHLLTSFRLQYGYSLFHLTNKI